MFLLRPAIFCLAISAILAPASISAQPWRDCVFLWNGFSQQWGYNHRLNRLGDYLEISPEIDPECRAAWVHTSASGSGADRASFSSQFTRLHLGELNAAPFSATLSLEGKEGELIRAETVLTFNELQQDIPGWSMAAVLNGFDLRTAEGAKADKAIHYYLGIDSAWASAETGTAHVRIAAEIRFACSSPECEVFKNEVRYELEVRGLLLHGQGLRSTPDRIGRGMGWTRDSLPDSGPIDASVLGLPGLPEAALGLQSLRLTLDDEHHFADWAMNIQPGTYEAASGRHSYRAQLYFGQWKRDQYAAFKEYYSGKPKIPPKWAVKRSKGSAIMEMGVLLLQFENAKTEAGVAEGELQWRTRPGKQASANDTMAVFRLILGE